MTAAARTPPPPAAAAFLAGAFLAGALLAGCGDPPPAPPAPPPEVLVGGDVGGRERGLGPDENLFSSGDEPWVLAEYLSVTVGGEESLWGAVPVTPGKQDAVDVTVTFRAAGNPDAGSDVTGCPLGQIMLHPYPSDGESPPGRLPFKIDGVIYQPIKSGLPMAAAEPAGGDRLRATVAVPVTDPFPPHGYLVYATVRCPGGTFATPLFTLVDATAAD